MKKKLLLMLGGLCLLAVVVVVSFIGYHEYSEIVRKEKFQAKYNPCGEGWPLEGFGNITLDELKKCMPMQNGVTRLTDAIASDRFDLAHFLIENGFNVNEEAKYLQTPLIQAFQLQKLREDDVALIRNLIEAGAKINLASSFGETPLMRAARMSPDPKAIELLQSYGADPSLTDKDGNTALHEAAGKFSNHGSVKVFQSLVEMGSDIRAKNLKGKTPYNLLWERKDEWSHGNQAFEEIDQILDTSVSLIVEDKQVHFPILPREWQRRFKTRLKSLIDEGAKECDGDFSMNSEAIHVFELNNTGESLTVLDEAEFECSSSASMYCGSGGCRVHFLLNEDSISGQVQGWEYIDGQVLLGLHGSACDQVGTEPCYKKLKIQKGRFNLE